MHQSVYPPLQADEHAKISDGLYLPAYFVAFLVIHGKVFPWVNLALLHAERNTPPLFIDFENHHFHFIAQLNDFGGYTFLLVQSISET